MPANQPIRRVPPFGARLADWVARLERPVAATAAPPVLSFAWLLRLRWAAVFGQAITVVLVRTVLGVPLPVPILLGLVGVTAVSNFVLCRRAVDEGAQLRRRFVRVLTLDTATLTALLLFSGGAANPFSSFYLVHVAMAAVALGRRAAWRMVALSAACLLGLYVVSRIFPPLLPVSHDLHLAGMLVAAVLAAAAIAFFAGHLHGALQRREAEVSRLRVAAEQSERFAALATLAAGVAHELGSPLGTILVAARELERAVAGRGDDEIAADVRLIASETERCRVLLGRLNARSTAELGEMPVACQAGEIFAQVRHLLAAPLAARLHTVEPPAEMLFLPRAAVVEAIASLVRNAGDATPGAVELSAEIAAGAAQVRFRVRDPGPRWSREVAAHWGEPFFTIKEPGRGMGLGLYLVRLLAERLEGSFSLTHDGAGTVAILALPLRAPFSPTP